VDKLYIWFTLNLNPFKLQCNNGRLTGEDIKTRAREVAVIVVFAVTKTSAGYFHIALLTAADLVWRTYRDNISSACFKNVKKVAAV